MTASMKARLNPFRSDRVEAFRYRLEDSDWDAILLKFRECHYRASIVGPHGTGKTVFLEDLEDHFQSSSGRPVTRMHFRDTFGVWDRDRLFSIIQNLEPQAVIFLDGAELIPPGVWKRLLKEIPTGNGLAATLHQQRDLPVLHQTRPRLTIALELISHLLDRPLRADETEIIKIRFKQFHGNIRDLIRSFYLDYAGIIPPDS